MPQSVPQSAPLSKAAAAGETIYSGKGGCAKCHSIRNRGGSLGPDLSEIGVRRTPESIRLSITDPDAEIYQEYLTVVVTRKDGTQTEGIALNEDDISIQLRDSEGNPHSFLKEDLRGVRREHRSLMPSYSGKLSAPEIDDLVAYLRTLRGVEPGGAEPSVEPPEITAPRGARPLAAARPSAARPSATGRPSTGARRREIAPLTTNITWLTRANRDSQERPEMLLDSLRIPPGATVADLGSGAGYFTWRLAQRVGPSGKVIAVDIQQRMLELTAAEVKKHGISNVRLVLGSERDPGLPTGGLDLVLIANAYHEFSQPEAMLEAARRSLKPHGRLVVLEYATEIDDDPTAGVYTMSLQELRSEIEPRGFQLDRILDFLPLQHGLIFTPTP